MNSIYFAYGSNMSAGQMAARCPGARPLGAACLEDFQLVFNRYSSRWQGHVADIVDSPGHQVWGVLWQVSGAHLVALDGFEGVAVGAYGRETVFVIPPGGDAIEAVAYRVVTPGQAGAPSAGYLDALITGAEEHNLPAPYCDFLRSIAPTTTCR